MPPAWLPTVRRASAAWVGITPEVRDALLALAPAPHTSVLVVPNPLPVLLANNAQPAPQPTGPWIPSVPRVVVVISTLTPNKRAYVEACIAAIRLCASARFPLELRIVGDGPAATALKQSARAAVADRAGLEVTFFGASIDPWRHLSGCDVVVGMGLVALEAAARGYKVVCASSEGVGGHFTVASYALLNGTNFTGRGIQPLSINGLATLIQAALVGALDPELADFVRSAHGTAAIWQWVSLWNCLLNARDD
ncbi:MAG: glycosyltransferase [Candidatus Limnocylindrales bacterium]